ncbi:MAG: hypothetical protein NTV93_20115 [Verrucomicrobia bacterium]|nr:hypothetical protein [Verrucomicrobiota bacterium]
MKLKHIHLAAFAALAFVGSAPAETKITYSFYTATSDTDTSWVRPEGTTSVKAMNFGSGAPMTSFGGVNWLTTNADLGQSANTASPISMKFSTSGEAYASNYGNYYSEDRSGILNTGSWCRIQGVDIDCTLVLSGFTVGQEYLVQFVLADTRVDAEGRMVAINGYSDNIAGQDSPEYAFAYPDGQFLVVTARFTPAPGDTAFSFRPLIAIDKELQLNALQVLTVP